MRVYNLEFIESFVKSSITRNPNISLKTLYKKARKNSKTEVYADYPILSFLVTKVNKITNKTYSRDQILRAVNVSSDCIVLTKKERSNITNNLMRLCAKDESN